MLEAIEIDLAGVSASLTSEDPAFQDYARLHLAPLRRRTDGPPAVSAVLRWHKGPPPRHPEGDLHGMERVDRDLYRGDGSLAWFRIDELPGLHLRCAWNGDRLEVAADFYHSLSVGLALLRRPIFPLCGRTTPGSRHQLGAVESGGVGGRRFGEGHGAGHIGQGIHGGPTP